MVLHDTFQLNEINVGENAQVECEAGCELHDTVKWLKYLVDSKEYTVIAILSSSSFLSLHLDLRSNYWLPNIPYYVLYGRWGGAEKGIAVDQKAKEDEKMCENPAFIEKFGRHASRVWISEYCPIYQGQNTRFESGDLSAFPKPQAAKGVHHAKFTLVICEEGIAIAIGTSNISRPACVEGTWTGFFPRHRGVTPSHAMEQEKECGNDFGPYLQTYLQELDFGVRIDCKSMSSFLRERRDSSSATCQRNSISVEHKFIWWGRYLEGTWWSVGMN